MQKNISRNSLKSIVLPRKINTLNFIPDSMATVLENFSILSLDVFDTILSRRTIQPTDVFSWMAVRYGIEGFEIARLRAEKDARKEHARRGAEVSLEEIYDAFPAELSLPDNIADMELEAETHFLFANPIVQDLIEFVRALGKRVIAISDTYLSAQQVEQLLTGVGIQLDKVYTSSDFRDEDIGKYNAKIFDRIAELEQTDKDAILHVGDNLVSDIANAKRAGVTGLWTRNLHEEVVVHDSLARFVVARAQTASDRIIVGQINKIIACSDTSQTVEERFGYCLGGPLVLGFLDFIQRTAKAEDVEKLILLERDGCILSEAAKLLPELAVPMRLMPCSRRMTALPCLAKGEVKPLSRLFSKEPISEVEFFDALVLPYPKDLDTTNETLNPAQTHLEIHEKLLMQHAKVELHALEHELREEMAMIAEGKKIAWVDVGWALSSTSALNTALGVEVPCYCIGSNARVSQTHAHEGYLYKQNHPSEVSDPMNVGAELIELIFSAQIPSTAHLSFDGSRVSRVTKPQPTEEHIRNIAIAGVHQGVLTFIKGVADLYPGLDMSQLRQFNRRLASDMCRTPPSQLYSAIARIPHDRMPGHQAWATVGDYWKPGEFDEATDSARTAELQKQLIKARSNPLKQLSILMLFKFLKVLSRLSPPLPHRAAERFARSARKRDPKRTSLL